MPINYKRYPPNWLTEIRPRILERARGKCEICGVPNYLWITRGKVGGEAVWQNDDGQIYSAVDGRYVGEDYVGSLEGKITLSKVVLTIAHMVDPDPMNCAEDNLKALCQRCHLLHDMAHHVAKARVTRNKKKKQLSLFKPQADNQANTL